MYARNNPIINTHLTVDIRHRVRRLGGASVAEEQLGVLPQVVRAPLSCARASADGADSIASVSGDLSSLTAPPFILSPISLTEFPGAWRQPTGVRADPANSPRRAAYWCERPELFAAIADATTDEDRSVAVLKWFIVRRPSSLPAQHSPAAEHAQGPVHVA